MEKAFDTLTASDMETLSTQATQKRESTRAAYESAYKRVTTLRKSYDDAVKAHAQVAKTEMLVAAFKALTDKHVQKLYVVKSKRTGSLALHLFLPAPRIVCTNKSKKDDLVTTKQRRPLVVITLPFANHKSVEIYDAEKWEETSKYVSYPHQTIDGGTPCWGHRGGLPLADQLIGAMVKYRVKQVLALLVEYLHQGGRNHKFRGESVSITNAKDTKRYEHARKEKKRGKKKSTTRAQGHQEVPRRRPQPGRPQRAAVPTLDDVIRQINNVSATYTSNLTKAETSTGAPRAEEQVGDVSAEGAVVVPANRVGDDALHRAEVGEERVQRVRAAGDDAGEVQPGPGVRGEQPVDDAAAK